MKRIYPLLLIFTFSIVSTSMCYSQNLLQNDADRNVQQRASEVADMWTKKLALRPKQSALMEDKLLEFILKENTVIQSKMREEAKTERLAELEIMENLHMRDILTKPQYELFIAIKYRQASAKEKKPID